MIIGFDMFDCQFFDSNISSGSVYRIEIENIKCDEFKIDTGTNTQIYNSQKQNWGLHTIALCDFKDTNYEAGNVQLEGMPIEYLRIKKRKSGEMTWQNYRDIPFNSNQTDYRWSDYFIQSLESYEYAIAPITQGIEGIYGIQSIDCEYEDIWLYDGNIQYHLQANIQKGDIQTVSPSVFIETLGSKYPYEISNGEISYKKGTLRATLVSDSTLNGNNGIDRKAEKELRDSLYKFLTNKKPKCYKDSDGYYILVSTKADSVKITPNNSLSRQVVEISFDFYEVENANDAQALKSCGLL